jgi:hypothetical protein
MGLYYIMHGGLCGQYSSTSSQRERKRERKRKRERILRSWGWELGVHGQSYGTHHKPKPSVVRIQLQFVQRLVDVQPPFGEFIGGTIFNRSPSQLLCRSIV